MPFKNMVCILASLSLATVLATFQKIGRIFFKFSGHPGGELVIQRFENSETDSS
jgi:hypothetical protein